MEEDDNLRCAVCNEIAKQRCSGCRNVAYCGKEHQKKDWKKHKTSCKPPPYEIKENEELGRYLVATKDLEVDEVIINELPIVSGPKQVSPMLCLGCNSPRPMSRCNKCLWPLCSELCSHSVAECMALSGSCAPLDFHENPDEPHYAYEAITVLRCILLQRMSPRRWKLIENMVAHEIERRNTETEKENQVRVVGFLRNFVGLSNWHGDRWDVSEQTIHKICGVLDVNALEIRLGDHAEIQALYATASLLEHSCIPNVRMRFGEDMKLTVSAAIPIKAGEHIKTSYTHSLWGTLARRQHLRENKYFWCKCDRCKDPTEFGSMFSALKCVNDGCHNAHLLPLDPLNEKSDWQCSNCKSLLSSHHVAELILRLAEEVEKTLSNPNITILELLLRRLNQLVHDNHYHAFAINHSLVQLLARGTNTTEEEEIRKRDLCEKLLNITKRIDPGSARLAVYEAVLCIELHSVKLQIAKRTDDSLVHLTETKAAKELLERAVYVLRSEPEHLPEGKLLKVAETSLEEIKECVERLELENN